MPRPSKSRNYAYEPEKQPILEAWPEFWWMSERDRSNAFEARARAYEGEGYRAWPLARGIKRRQYTVRRHSHRPLRQAPAQPSFSKQHRIIEPPHPDAAWAPLLELLVIRQDAFVDYCRILKPAGGILITYKEYDRRSRHIFWRVFAWSAATGFELWFISTYSLLETCWTNVLCLLVATAVNFLIVPRRSKSFGRSKFAPTA